MAFHSRELERDFLINMMVEGNYLKLDNPVTEEHFYYFQNQNIFKAVKQLIDDGEDVNPASVQQLSGEAEDYIKDLLENYSPIKINESYKYLEELRLKRMVQNEMSEVLEQFSDTKGVHVPQVIQRLSNRLTDNIKLETKRGDFAERTRQHLIELTNGDIKGISTGLNAFDEAIGEMFQGELHIIAGFPSVGKSALALQIARNLAKEGCGVRYFSLEEDERNYMKRIICAETGFPYSAYRNGLTAEQRKQQPQLYTKVFQEGGTLYGKNFEVDDENDTLESIYLASAKHKKKHGLDVIIVDGATNINHPETSVFSKNEDIAQTMLRIAKKLKITVILLAHINNDLMKKDKDGNKKAPDMSSLMGGQTLVKPAFSVTILDRVTDEFVPNQATEINGHLVKSRNSAPNQVMRFNFDGVKQTYSSRGVSDKW